MNRLLSGFSYQGDSCPPYLFFDLELNHVRKAPHCGENMSRSLHKNTISKDYRIMLIIIMGTNDFISCFTYNSYCPSFSHIHKTPQSFHNLKDILHKIHNSIKYTIIINIIIITSEPVIPASANKSGGSSMTPCMIGNKDLAGIAPLE